MEAVNVTTIVAATVAVSAPLTAILTLVLTRGVDALLKLRKDNREGVAESSVREENEYKFVIAELKAVVSTLQVRLDAGHADHLECVKSHGVLEGRVIQMEYELATYRKLALPAKIPQQVTVMNQKPMPVEIKDQHFEEGNE